MVAIVVYTSKNLRNIHDKKNSNHQFILRTMFNSHQIDITQMILPEGDEACCNKMEVICFKVLVGH